MKTINILLLLILSTMVLSCSKDDTPNNNTKTAIVKLEITNVGSIENFSQNVSIELGSENSDTESLNVNGVVWDDTMVFPYVKLFAKNGNVANTTTYETNQKIISFTCSMIIKPINAETEPLTTTLNFYVDDVLVKTMTVTTTNNENEYSQITENIYVPDY